MDRVSHFVFVSWDGEEASIESMDGESFDEIRRNIIDDGYYNMQIEWFEKGNQRLPDRVKVFVYWEYSHISPSYELVQSWGLELVKTK